MADNRTISQLEAKGYPWIGCDCCNVRIQHNIHCARALSRDQYPHHHFAILARLAEPRKPMPVPVNSFAEHTQQPKTGKTRCG
jgi:hypothetical protein